MINIISRKLIKLTVCECKILPSLFENKSIGFKIKSNIGNCSQLRSCTTLYNTNEPNTAFTVKTKKDQDAPVDWLPFEWKRRPIRNYFADSGDYVKKLEYDPSWPKPGFELSEELKTASDDVKNMFSLATGSKADIKEVVQRKFLEKVQRHPHDFDSLEVKIALMTLKIRSLFEHGRQIKKERQGGRILLHNLIQKRFKLLKILYRRDYEKFEFVTKELQLYYKPEKLGGRKELYWKKWDLRRLTKEYCENTVNSKKVAYHEELKEQQEEFLKEKEDILAWIEKEEEELKKLDAEILLDKFDGHV